LHRKRNQTLENRFLFLMALFSKQLQKHSLTVKCLVINLRIVIAWRFRSTSSSRRLQISLARHP
jgi:hypothetical protein